MLAAYDDTPPTANTTPAARAAWNNTGATGEPKAGFERPVIVLAASHPDYFQDGSWPYSMADNTFDSAADGVAGFTEDQLRGQLFLVKDHNTGANNGLWVYALGGWERSAITLKHGLQVTAQFGANAGKVYELSTADPITPGVTALTFGALTTAGAAKAKV